MKYQAATKRSHRERTAYIKEMVISLNNARSSIATKCYILIFFFFVETIRSDYQWFNFELLHQQSYYQSTYLYVMNIIFPIIKLIKILKILKIKYFMG